MMPPDITSNVALGVLGSFIASILFLAALFARRPRLRISDRIARTDLNEKPAYAIKVVNVGWFDCINLRAELVLVQPDKVAGGIAKRIAPVPLLKDCVFVLRSPRSAGAQGSVAFVFVTQDDLAVTWKKQEDRWQANHPNEPEVRPYIHIVVYGQDGLSNFGRVFDMSYKSAYHDLQTGEFEHGSSLEICSTGSARGDA